MKNVPIRISKVFRGFRAGRQIPYGFLHALNPLAKEQFINDNDVFYNEPITKG